MQQVQNQAPALKFYNGLNVISSRLFSSRPVSWRAWWNRFAVLLVAVGIGFGLATYAAMSEIPPFGNDPDAVIWLLNVDLLVLVILTIMVAHRIVAIWSGRRRGLAGSHLHVRLVSTFSILVAAPAVIMTLFSAVFFHYGIQAWFGQRVQTAITESQVVAQAYLEEHKQVIRADVLAMATDLNRQAVILTGNSAAFERVMHTQSTLRNLPEAIVFNDQNSVIARSGITFSLEFETISQIFIEQADEGEVVILTGGAKEDRLRALVRLSGFDNSYLYVGRAIDPKVLTHLDATEKAVNDYANLQTRYTDLQVTVTIIFLVVGLLLLLAAIWFGLVLAKQLVTPITTLISTADRVRGGDFTARVPDTGTVQEFDYLAKSFNRMTKQIQEQQTELINANRQLDRRRRFTETVLTGVSSGVIGVDENGLIHLANSSACKLLGYESDMLNGTVIHDSVSGFEPLLKRAYEEFPKEGNVISDQIEVIDSEGRKKMFLLRIAVELIGETEKGAVVTFDDITELQAAQRKAAWADVARRIAHEIKNPLTPIQLSAERLRRKYLSQIEDDQGIFEQCTDTIIKHVGDIGLMVDEFSSFARMPAPNLKIVNIEKLIEDSVFLQSQAHGDIEFKFDISEGQDVFETAADEQQIRQVLTNLLQNAIDSIHGRYEEGSKEGCIEITLARRDDSHGADIVMIMSDNGQGFPKDADPASLTEPYVTHKEKGTGLGLAIVKKIIEDHKGELALDYRGEFENSKGWNDLGGASLAIILPSDR